MFRCMLNCAAIACAISILPHAAGVLRADPEGECRRECANFKCFVVTDSSGVYFCGSWTDVHCQDGSADYCNPDIGCGSGPCEDWLEDGKKKSVELLSCTPTEKCSTTCPTALNGKNQPALGCASAKCVSLDPPNTGYRTRCKGGSK